jgi:hypothetical protein
MEPEIGRRRVTVAVRLGEAEHRKWLRAAVREDVRLVELIREAVRQHLRQLETLTLLGRTAEPDRAAPRAAGKVA